MKPTFKPEHFTKIATVLGVLLFAKLVWFGVEIAFLSSVGVDRLQSAKTQPLFYRIKLSIDKVPTQTTTPKPITATARINDIKLISIYNTEHLTVVTVVYKNQTKVLRTGEEIDGFVLIEGGSDYVIFQKSRKKYRVDIEQTKLSSANQRGFIQKPLPVEPEKQTEPTGEIVNVREDYKIIDRSLVSHYAGNLREIGKHIGVVPSRNGNKIEGFRISHISETSDFAKVGLQRGDVIKAVNGQPVNGYEEAMQVYKTLYKKMDEVDGMMMTIQRGNQEMELEYEVH